MHTSLIPFLPVFRRELLRIAPHAPDHYAQLYWDDRGAFDRVQRAAWASIRPEPYISLTQTQGLNETLAEKTVRRLARRLAACERFQEVVELLHDRLPGLGQDAFGLLDLARAEIGLGRLSEAAAAVARARDLDPQAVADADEIDQTIAGLRAAEDAARASGDWPEARALFDRWIEAGSARAGMGVLAGVLKGRTALARDQVRELHEALDIALSLYRPASAYNLLRAMERLPAYELRLGQLRTTSSWLYAVSTGAAPYSPLDVNAAGLLIGGSAAIDLGESGRTQPAIDTLGALTLAFPEAQHVRAPLAQFVGREVLASHPLTYRQGSGGRVFDVFLFNNELRLLKMKLHEMADWVDGFVLVEARRTFTGAPKPLVFEQNKEQFAEFASKIIHVVVDDFPPHVRHPWAREFYQRDMGITGLNGRCHEDDLVIVSDSDEVVSSEAVLGFRGEYAPLGMQRMRYFVNYRQALPPQSLKRYSCLWRARYLAGIDLSSARIMLAADKKVRSVADAGWHFTSIADASGIAEKLNNSSHQEHAGASSEAIAERLALLRAGQLEPGWERCELDERFPAYLRERRAEFEDVLI